MLEEDEVIYIGTFFTHLFSYSFKNICAVYLLCVYTNLGESEANKIITVPITVGFPGWWGQSLSVK